MCKQHVAVYAKQLLVSLVETFHHGGIMSKMKTVDVTVRSQVLSQSPRVKSQFGRSLVSDGALGSDVASLNLFCLIQNDNNQPLPYSTEA